MTLVLEIAAGIVLGGLVLVYWEAVWPLILLIALGVGMLAAMIFAISIIADRHPEILWAVGGLLLAVFAVSAIYGVVAGFMGWEIE